MGERVHKSILNAKVGLLFYFLSLLLSFFSRKIFLNNLGADFIGLTGTLGNFLGFLNLAELGVGTAISFFLYKPLHADKKEKMTEILSVFGYLYRKVGMFIAICGILLSLFFPLIFKETIFNLGIIYFAFFSFLGSSLIGYFINYRQILLSADQKNYIVDAYFQTATMIKTIVQIILAYYYKNLYVWVLIELLFSIVCCVILNWKIAKEYPWLKTDVAEGKKILKNYPHILTNTKQIFIHKFKDFLLTKSDELLIYAFVSSFKMVAFYGNYTLITWKLNTLVNTALNGVNAGVGNLVAEGNSSNTLKVFWELISIRYFVAGVMVFALFYLTEPFIICWLGKEYLLSHHILILLLINFFIMQTRGTVDIFNHAHGLYADTWAAWTEGIINIGITVLTAVHWGITGILLGKIASISIIVIIWKPYYLFNKGFRMNVSVYWKKVIWYYLIFFFSFAASGLLAKFLPINPSRNFYSLILYAVCITLPFTILYFTLLYYFASGMKDLTARFPFFNKIFRR